MLLFIWDIFYMLLSLEIGVVSEVLLYLLLSIGLYLSSKYVSENKVQGVIPTILVFLGFSLFTLVFSRYTIPIPYRSSTIGLFPYYFIVFVALYFIRKSIERCSEFVGETAFRTFFYSAIIISVSSLFNNQKDIEWLFKSPGAFLGTFGQGIDEKIYVDFELNAYGYVYLMALFILNLFIYRITDFRKSVWIKQFYLLLAIFYLLVLFVLIGPFR